MGTERKKRLCERVILNRNEKIKRKWEW